jgi:hypothetical protein
VISNDKAAAATAATAAAAWVHCSGAAAHTAGKAQKGRHLMMSPRHL